VTLVLADDDDSSSRRVGNIRWQTLDVDKSVRACLIWKSVKRFLARQTRSGACAEIMPRQEAKAR